MAIKDFFQSRRLIFGGLAASLGLATVVAPVVTSSATAQPVEGPGPIQPNAISAPGTYEACTPYFGLTKENADLLSFDVVNVDNAVTPIPVIGTDIVPVLTVTDGTQSFECVPDLGWTDEATWQSDYVNGDGNGFIVNGLISYPGTGYYLMPAVDGSTSFHLIGGGTILPTSSSLRFETNFTGRTITVSPSSLVHTFGGYLPVLADLSSTQLADSYFAAVIQQVMTAGDAVQYGYLIQLLTAGVSTFCSDGTGEPAAPSQVFPRLLETMSSLLQSVWFVRSCRDISDAAAVLYNAEVQKAKVTNSLVTLTITDPNPTTTTTSTTTTAVEPVAPAFTG